jgi:hypothetical protein
MKQLLGNISRKALLIGGVVLGVALVSGIGLAAAAALHAPNASAAQNVSAQTSSDLSAQNFRGHGHVVRVVSVSGNTLTVAAGPGKKVQQRTLMVNSDAKITKYGQPAKLSDLQPGEWIRVSGPDARHIQQIDILGFAAAGAIQTLNNSGFTLLARKPSGTGTVTVNVSSSTKIQEAQLSISLSDLQAGESVIVFGDKGSSGSLNALLVRVHLVRGQVTAIKGNTITLGRGLKGAEISVTTSAATKYYLAGQQVAASQLRVGDVVGVAGTISNKTSVTATAIFIRQPRVAGRVTSVSGNAITLQTRGGVTWTVTVDSSTKYLKDGQPASLSDVQKGSLIEVVGVRSGDNAITASIVHIHTHR